jgi:hypothetical protein
MRAKVYSVVSCLFVLLIINFTSADVKVQVLTNTPYPPPIYKTSKIWPVWNSLDVFTPIYTPANNILIYDFISEIRYPGGCEGARDWGEWRDSNNIPISVLSQH